MTLKEAIRAFKQDHRQWSRPRGAHGDCSHASHLFIDYLKTNYVREGRWAKEVHYTAATARHYPIKVKFLTMEESEGILREALRPTGGWTDHVVVQIGRLRIDWTARQFDKKAAFPLIWRTKS